MSSKFQSLSESSAPHIEEFEGAITSSSNVRPDEVILKIFDSNAIINITFLNGKKIDLPLHIKSEGKNSATLVIPEKFYKESEAEPELRDLLSGVFDNQRSLEVEVNIERNRIIVQPVGSKKNIFKIIFVR